MKLREILRSEYSRQARKVVAGEVQILQILQSGETFWQGNQAVSTDIQALELSKFANVLARIQVLKEGVRVSEESEFLSRG